MLILKTDVALPPSQGGPLDVVIGNHPGIYKAINTATERQRYTRLQQRLCAELPGD